MAEQLVLLRHGESEWNHSDRFTGWTDVDLNPTGIAQAERAGTWLREAGFAEAAEGLRGGGDRGVGLVAEVEERVTNAVENGRIDQAEADEAEAGLEDEADEAEAELDEAEVELRENMQN